MTKCIRGTGKVHHPTGYLRKRINNELFYQHRLAYLNAHGSIPAKHEIHHECHNKWCINPDHLVALTSKEHKALHVYPEARAAKAAQTVCKYGHPLYQGKVQRYCKTCANVNNAKNRAKPGYREWYNDYRRAWRARQKEIIC